MPAILLMFTTAQTIAGMARSHTVCNLFVTTAFMLVE